jgi:hypothetical protein
MEYKSISAKIPRTEYTLINEYCHKKGTTPSALIRDLLLKEIEIPSPHHIAGRNRIAYDKEKDNYSWTVELDDGETIEVIKNVSPEYLKDLTDALASALETRTNTIKQKAKGSVPVPERMVKK